MQVPSVKLDLHEQFYIGKLLQSDQTHPYTQVQVEGCYYFKSPDQRGRKYQGGDEATPDICWVIFHPDDLTLSPTIPTDDGGRTDPPSGAGATPADQEPTDTNVPESVTPMAIESSNIFQTAPNKHKVKARTNNLPTITT